MCVVLEVGHEGFRSSVHSLLQSNGERARIWRDSPFFSGFGFLKERSPNWSAMKSSLPKVTLLPGYSCSGSSLMLKMTYLK
jgi:hypothetical protein